MKPGVICVTLLMVGLAGLSTIALSAKFRTCESEQCGMCAATQLSRAGYYRFVAGPEVDQGYGTEKRDSTDCH